MKNLLKLKKQKYEPENIKQNKKQKYKFKDIKSIAKKKTFNSNQTFY